MNRRYALLKDEKTHMSSRQDTLTKEYLYHKMQDDDLITSDKTESIYEKICSLIPNSSASCDDLTNLLLDMMESAAYDGFIAAIKLNLILRGKDI